MDNGTVFVQVANLNVSFHCQYDNLLTAESQRAQREFSFSFAAKTRLRMKLRRDKRW
jgi:hypothetical protein